jgi:hypothetical protein
MNALTNVKMASTGLKEHVWDRIIVSFTPKDNIILDLPTAAFAPRRKIEG